MVSSFGFFRYAEKSTNPDSMKNQGTQVKPHPKKYTGSVTPFAKRWPSTTWVEPMKRARPSGYLLAALRVCNIFVSLAVAVSCANAGPSPFSGSVTFCSATSAGWVGEGFAGVSSTFAPFVAWLCLDLLNSTAASDFTSRSTWLLHFLEDAADTTSVSSPAPASETVRE